MKFFILLAALMLSIPAHADRYIAFDCTWDNGDISGAEEVEDYETSLRWTVDLDEAKYTVVIANIKKDTSPATVMIETKTKATIKSATCEITD